MKPNPAATGRLAAGLYVLSAIPAGFSIWVLLRMVARGDPGATANRILGSESLFRLGFVADLVGILLVLASMIVMYELFKPASRRLSLLMLFAGAIGSAVQSLDSVADMTALLLLKGGSTTAALTAAQTQALAYQAIKLHSVFYELALVFFGVFSILIGALILRSTFVPRVIGPLMMIDGLGYLTFSFASFLSPAFAAHISPPLPYLTAMIGEGSLMVWLLMKGVNAPRWEEQAAAAA